MYIISATQKGVAYFKSTAMPFFYNSGAVGARKLQISKTLSKYFQYMRSLED